MIYVTYITVYSNSHLNIWKFGFVPENSFLDVDHMQYF